MPSLNKFFNFISDLLFNIIIIIIIIVGVVNGNSKVLLHVG